MEKVTVQPIDEKLLTEIARQATDSPRKRMNHNFHQYRDPVQRFLNGIEPDAYIQPHCHINPIKDEIFLVLKGRGAVITFDDEGTPLEVHPLDIDKGFWGVDIPGTIFHTIVSLQQGSVFYEVKQGPYDPDSAKNFAPWAPQENSKEAAGYLDNLKTLAKKHINGI